MGPTPELVGAFKRIFSEVWLIYSFRLRYLQIGLIYSIGLISAIQQNDSVMHLYILCRVLFHHNLLQDIEYTSLC